MSLPKRIIDLAFTGLFAIVPILFLPHTSELFEFNKLLVTYILTTLIMGTWLIRCILEKKLIFKRSLLDIPLIVFLIAQSLSLLFSIDPQTSFLGYYGRWNGGLLSLLSYAFLYWAYVSNMDKKSSNFMLRVSCLTATLVAGYGILQHFGIDAHKWVQDVQTRVFSTMGQPNWLAAYLVALIFISLSLERINLKGVSLFIILFICLLFTKSRSGLLAFGISSAIFILLQKHDIKKTLLLFTIPIILSLAIANPIRDLIIKSNTPPPNGSALDSGGTESGSIRKIVWTGAFNAWKANPKTILIGSGPETFAMIYYQFRPIEHNNTSEWELLYNKAHNEYLNYLTTTGVLGLGSYLVLILTALLIIIKSRQPALLAGYVSILVTNFWGFSVVIVQILLFLLPAIAISYNIEKVSVQKNNKLSKVQVLSIILILFGICYLVFGISKYWLADYHYAKAQKFENQFTQTEDSASLLQAFNESTYAYDLNPSEPFMASQLGNLSAYLSVLTAEVDATSSAQLSQLAAQSSQRAISLSPSHPAHYKSASRAFILLSTFDPKYLQTADELLKISQTLSPTDPRLPFNRGIIANYQQATDSARQFFSNSLKLKPDFTDAQNQLK